MGIQRFFCHNNWQDFKKYEHKTLDRVYFFGQCQKCGKYFFIKDEEVIEGKKAKEWYKYLRPNLKIVSPEYVIKFLKSLCFATPAREILETVYATDENGNVIVKKFYEEIYKKDKKGKLVLDEEKKPIIIDRKLIGRKKFIKSRIYKEYQNIQIENKGIIETVTNSIELGIKPTVYTQNF